MPRNRDIKVIFSADHRPLARGARLASGEISDFERRAVLSSNRVRTAFRGIGSGLLGIAGGVGVGAGVASIVRTNAEFQKLSASLESVAGSRESARRAFDDIEEFAKRTPYQLSEVVSAFTKLKALGLEPSMAALESYGNTASAMGKSLDQFIEAIADAATGEFERLKEFGIKARKEGEQVSFTFQGVTTTVVNSATTIEQYLRKIGNVQFAGAMARQMDTLNGKFSNLSDASDRLARAIGDAGLNSVVKSVTESLIGMADAATAAIKAATNPSLAELQSRLDRIDSGPTGGRSGRVTRASRRNRLRDQINDQLSELPGAAGIRNQLKTTEDALIAARDRISDLTAQIGTIPEDRRNDTSGTGRSKRKTLFGRLNAELDEANQELEMLTAERERLFGVLADAELKFEQASAADAEKTATAVTQQKSSASRSIKLPLPRREEVKAAIDPVDEFIESLQEYRRELDLINPRLERLGKLYADGAIPLDVYTEGIKRLGFETESMFDDLPEQIEETNDAINELGLTFQSAFEDAIVEGKNLRDVLSGLEQDISRLLTRKLVTEKITGKISGAFDDGGIFGDLFGGIFGGGKASGGPVIAGTPYLVGERGPELFVPRSSGAIMPNNQLGGSTIVVNVNPPPGASPEAYRLSARQGALEGSRLLNRARGIS